MIKNNCHHSVLWLPFAIALPFGLLAAGAMSAHAGTVTVTGANGANGGAYSPAGAGGSATATTTTPSDLSNTATATGGNGGSAALSIGRAGGAGGAASSTATTSINSGAASAEAFGGDGGAGGYGEGGSPPGPGGLGGAASSNAAASSTTGSASATASSHGGDRGEGRPPSGAGGSALAGAAANSTGNGQVQANASAFSGQPGGSASVSANAQNGSGKAMTTAAAPAAGPASALANAAVGPGSESLVDIGAGQAVSNAILTPNNGKVIGVGAMSEGYGGTGQALQYKSTAVLDFSTNESLNLDLLSYNSSGIGFNSLELQVVVNATTHTYNFSSLTGPGGAETFFTAHSISLGPIAAGNQVSLIYELNYNAGTPTTTVDGFGFTYQFVDPPVTTAVSLAAAPLNGGIPEPSTWAMMTLGFAGLAFASYRASRKGARNALRSSSLSTPSILGGVFSFPPAVS